MIPTCGRYVPVAKRVFGLLLFCGCTWLLLAPRGAEAQTVEARRSGFTWISPTFFDDPHYGSGFSFYTAAYPIHRTYPGPRSFQTGLSSSWMSTQRSGTEPAEFYTTIEGGLGWWSDTRFGTRTPKFIMGGVSYNFFAWANGPGAGQSELLPSGQRDWSTPGGKYGIAQLSPYLLWPPDGLNLAAGEDGELLGYGYLPLPLTEPLTESVGAEVLTTGNQCWTLFFNAENFKGPATFFLPTFWTRPVLEDPRLEGLFLDTRPSDPEVGFGVELAETPALIAYDDDVPYARVLPLQYPRTSEGRSLIFHRPTVYTAAALSNRVADWFAGGPVAPTAIAPQESRVLALSEDSGDFVGEIVTGDQEGEDFPIDLYAFTTTFQQDDNALGFQWDPDYVREENGRFVTPEYFRFGPDAQSREQWLPIDAAEVPPSTELQNTPVPFSPRNDHLPYLTPMEPDCHWRDPNGPWTNPGPAAGPFTVDLADGSRLTYYWYRFVDQPAIVRANLPDSHRERLQTRVELMHQHWTTEEEYLQPPTTGSLARIDPGLLVRPPAGMGVGYVPIVTRQERAPRTAKVFILAGQSNMEGYGEVSNADRPTGTLVDVLAKDSEGKWSFWGEANDWLELDQAWLYYDRSAGTIRDRITVGQGAFPELIGPELMFGRVLDDYYEDPVLILKMAWGGEKSGR